MQLSIKCAIGRITAVFTLSCLLIAPLSASDLSGWKDYKFGMSVQEFKAVLNQKGIMPVSLGNGSYTVDNPKMTLFGSAASFMFSLDAAGLYRIEISGTPNAACTRIEDEMFQPKTLPKALVFDRTPGTTGNPTIQELSTKYDVKRHFDNNATMQVHFSPDITGKTGSGYIRLNATSDDVIQKCGMKVEMYIDHSSDDVSNSPSNSLPGKDVSRSGVLPNGLDIGVLMTLYATGQKCAGARIAFSIQDINAMKAAIKTSLDKLGTDQAERDNDWTIAQKAVASQSLTEQDCQRIRQELVTIWPDAFAAPMQANPF